MICVPSVPSVPSYFEVERKIIVLKHIYRNFRKQPRTARNQEQLSSSEHSFVSNHIPRALVVSNYNNTLYVQYPRPIRVYEGSVGDSS